MKHHGDNEAYIRSNIDSLNRYLQKLADIKKECLIFVIRNLVFTIWGDLKLNSPVITGNLRGHWGIPIQLHETAWRIYNDADYILEVEYGVSHPLSADPEKRKASLRYLFWKGILKEEDGVIVYCYEPTGSAGFVRRTIEDWQQKAPDFIKTQIEIWIEKQRRQTT